MRLRTLGLAAAAGIAAFLAAFVAVTELLVPYVAFSVFVGIPAGIVVGAVVAAFVLWRFETADAPRQRSLAVALSVFGGALVTAFVLAHFALGQGAVVSILAATLVGALAGIAAFGRERRAAVRSWMDRHRIASFLAVTYAFTWTVQGALAATGLEASWTHSILIGFGGFGPPVGAAVVVAATGGSLRQWVSQAFAWNIGARWWALAFGLPLVVLVVGSALFVALGGPIDLGSFASPAIYLFVLAWGIVWGGGQEELGWRGFMLPLLQERYSALSASLLVGVAWAAWHLPLLLNATTTHGGWGPSQQVLWLFTIVAGSILWTWMYNGTGGSVLAVAVFHAGINAMGLYHPADMDALLPGGVPDPWLNFLAELTGAVPLVALAVIVVVVYGRERLTNGDVPGAETVGLAPGTKQR
ncbi:CPBP family glutamic-type intramembrane protease [Halobellus sp. GM3]|uniref:CPBP family glutamic-type intramembrane protease n=1 Tax=Halobellus sp. GM3 TaxID=3458410 RepID=UPI00403E35FA